MHISCIVILCCKYIKILKRGTCIAISEIILKIELIKGTVSRDLRWVLLYINRMLSSRAIVILLKGTLYNLKKKILRQNGLVILDALPENFSDEL